MALSSVARVVECTRGVTHAVGAFLPSRRKCRRLGERTPVVVTGGWASRLQPHVHIASPLVFAPNLVLDGLASLL